MKIKLVLEMTDGKKLKLTEAEAKRLHRVLDDMYGTPKTTWYPYTRPFYYSTTGIGGLTSVSTPQASYTKEASYTGEWDSTDLITYNFETDKVTG